MAKMVDRLRPMPPLTSITLKNLYNFWSKIDRKSSDECWPWIAQVINGYGMFSMNHNTYVATRVAYYLEYRKDPAKQLVLHDCNNSICCNSKHLHLGSQSENMIEMYSAHRQTVGAPRCSNVLTVCMIPSIRQRLMLDESQASIARSLGVSKSVIQDVASGDTWKYIL